MISAADEGRFWGSTLRPDAPDACWIWLGRRRRDGYGGFRAGGDEIAHRVAWHIFTGSRAGRLFVCHRCDNRLCVRPSHLFLGTAGDNNADRHAKGRSSGGSQPGEANPRSKLTSGQVLEIAAAISRGDASQVEIGRRYGVSQQTVHHIATRKRWLSLWRVVEAGKDPLLEKESP